MNDDAKYDAVLFLAQEKLRLAGFNPLVIVPIIQIVISLIQLCVPKTGDVFHVPITMIGRLRLDRALRKAGIDVSADDVIAALAFNDAQEETAAYYNGQVKLFVEAARRLGE